MLCRNPYSLEEKEKPLLILVSPTRLTKEKGGELMLKLANTLDRLGIGFLWLIITTQQYQNESIFNNPNVVYVRNRLDIDRFLQLANWVVLPSECEGDSYTIREALYRGIPIVARHLKYFDEYGIEDGKNALFIDENNVEEVAKRMQQKLTFTFKPIEDGYDKLVYKSKSYYEEEKNMKVKVRCIKEYYDLELKVFIKPIKEDENYERVISKMRADEIIERTNGAIEILNIVQEEKEKTKSSTKNEKPLKKEITKNKVK